ncbi:MAG: protein-glutamate O-methyltransferase CheR [Gammaproteobacteria bacterium]|nr:protein-glutamate O-methyltransferase CheR [Gammaproteobacteria bacterium]
MEQPPGLVDFAIEHLPKMEREQFLLWAELLKKRTGMRFPDNRISFLVTNLGMRMRALGINDYQRYFDYVQNGRQGIIEWDRLIHHLTVHETRFLRHENTLALITQHYLPTSKEQCPATPVSIHTWSVGCSTGEEPYGIAMAIDDHMNTLGCEYYLGVTASDISRDAITQGQVGIYNSQKIKKIGAGWQDKYFEPTRDGRFQVIEQLRKRVCFNQLNILDIGDAPIGKMDIITCHNLLIYFDQEQRVQIANTLADHLLPGGLLMLGVGELLNWTHPHMERFHFANTLAFQRQ